MDIFRSRFYRINVNLLSMLGLWPYQKHKSWQLFQQIMCQISVITIIIPEIIEILEKWSDIDIIIECLTPMGVQLLACTKSINCLIHRKKMTKLLEMIKRDWSSLRNDKEIEILSKYAEEGRILTIIYLGERNTFAQTKVVQQYNQLNLLAVLYRTFMSCSTILYLLMPLLPRFLDVIVPLNESRPYVYPFPTQYYVDSEEYFKWISLHTYSGSIVTMAIVIAADTMFTCYVMHICGMLAVIGHRLENLTSKCSDTNVGAYIMSTDDDNRCHREIVLCIDQHHKATEVAKIIESSYSISYLIVLGICVFLLSISGVQLLMKFGQVEEMIRIFEFNLGQCIHLLFISWSCQKLIDESVYFRESLYAAEWYSLSQKNKNLLRFAMMRALKPQKITAGKISDMSIENFGVVIQTALSYFTVFASIQ